MIAGVTKVGRLLTFVTACVVVCFASPSIAHEKTRVGGEGWAWVAQREGLPDLGPVSGINDGQLPVAWAQGREEKVSFLKFVGLPDEGSFGMTIAIDDSGANRMADQADLLACVITAPWKSAFPMTWERRPTTNCTAAPRGVYEASTASFFFELTSSLESLSSSMSHGVALVPDPTTQRTHFQVVFRSAREGGVRLSHQARVVIEGRDERQVPGSRQPALVDTFRPDTPPDFSSPSATDPVTSTRNDEKIQPPSAKVQSAPTRGGQASTVRFYAGMLALAVLIVLRRFLPALREIVRAGIGDAQGESVGPYRRREE